MTFADKTIARRLNELRWPRVVRALSDGASFLLKPSGYEYFYIARYGDGGKPLTVDYGIGLSPAFVREQAAPEVGLLSPVSSVFFVPTKLLRRVAADISPPWTTADTHSRKRRFPWRTR